MMALAARPKRRRRRLIFLTLLLALSTGAMGIVVCRRIEQMRMVAWIAAVNELGVAADLEEDVWDTSLLGRARNWLKIPTVQVYVWGEPEAKKLLRAPAGGPRPLLFHIHEQVSDSSRLQLAERFPGAELRQVSNQGFF